MPFQGSRRVRIGARDSDRSRGERAQVYSVGAGIDGCCRDRLREDQDSDVVGHVGRPEARSATRVAGPEHSDQSGRALAAEQKGARGAPQGGTAGPEGRPHEESDSEGVAQAGPGRGDPGRGAAGASNGREPRALRDAVT